jgi:hypothetical protein
LTPEQRRVLHPVIKAVAHHNPHLWWELKRQIFDFGYQQYYPRQSEFDHPVRGAIENLRENEKEMLVTEWRRTEPSRADLAPDTILTIYSTLVIEEIVKRAWVAVKRTTNW